MQILAFDFGTKKIGVAVGQTITKSSSPLAVVFNKDNRVNWDQILEIINEWQPQLMLIGKPLNMDGTPSDMMKQVNKFYTKLQKETNIACELVDERLTSFEAKQLAEADSKSTRIDNLAAKIFLDNWMEHHVNS